MGTEEDALTLVDLEVLSKSGQPPKSKIVISYQGKEHSAEASGDGAVDAIFKAIESLVSSETNLQLYSVNAVTEGTDSQGGVTVRLEKDGQYQWTGGGYRYFGGQCQGLPPRPDPDAQSGSIAPTARRCLMDPSLQHHYL